jgi:hypothetical protein
MSVAERALRPAALRVVLRHSAPTRNQRRAALGRGRGGFWEDRGGEWRAGI